MAYLLKKACLKNTFHYISFIPNLKHRNYE